MKIVFMGTPKFAVTSLDTIFRSKHELLGVVTSTDKPAGRGNKIQQSAVKKYALENNLSIYQPEKLKDENFVKNLEELNADLFVVVAFRMLPEIIWKIPKKGTINLHASILPNYRGAAPINWAIINGEKESGVTTFFINEKIDTGDVLQNEKISIIDGQTAGELHDKLMLVGSKLLIKTINTLEKGNYKTRKQKKTENQSVAPKLRRENTKIDWSKSAFSIRQLILGLNPYPGAWTIINKEEKPYNFKIFNAKLSDQKVPEKNILIDDNKLFVGTKTNALELIEVQMEGKKKMMVNEFLKGNKNIKNYILL